MDEEDEELQIALALSLSETVYSEHIQNLPEEISKESFANDVPDLVSKQSLHSNPDSSKPYLLNPLENYEVELYNTNDNTESLSGSTECLGTAVYSENNPLLKFASNPETFKNKESVRHKKRSRREHHIKEKEDIELALALSLSIYAESATPAECLFPPKNKEYLVSKNLICNNIHVAQSPTKRVENVYSQTHLIKEQYPEMKQNIESSSTSSINFSTARDRKFCQESFKLIANGSSDISSENESLSESESNTKRRSHTKKKSRANDLPGRVGAIPQALFEHTNNDENVSRPQRLIDTTSCRPLAIEDEALWEILNLKLITQRDRRNPVSRPTRLPPSLIESLRWARRFLFSALTGGTEVAETDFAIKDQNKSFNFQRLKAVMKAVKVPATDKEIEQMLMFWRQKSCSHEQKNNSPSRLCYECWEAAEVKRETHELEKRLNKNLPFNHNRQSSQSTKLECNWEQFAWIFDDCHLKAEKNGRIW